MTGPTDITHTATILIDQYEDGYIEQTGWIEVTSEINDPRTAVVEIEAMFPAGERDEEETYVCDGSTVWQKPDPVELFKARVGGYTYDEGPWVDAEEGEGTALQFWVIKVVCAA